MKTIAFYDTKPYDKIWFDKFKDQYGFDIKYFDNKLNADTAVLALGSDAVVAFVNDVINKEVVDFLYKNNIKILGMRCAGYNNVDFLAANKRIRVVNVPNYSPYSVAEHAFALLLTLNRKIHRAYNRTRENNFSINGLTGFDLFGKTVGVIGTGKIGRVFINIARGFGMNVIAYDPYPAKDSGIEYVGLDELFKTSDIISLHCPLNDSTFHIVNEKSFELCKRDVIIINTSRGALIESHSLLNALKIRKIKGAVLDVYEEENAVFFHDFSGKIIDDDILTGLISLPNVIVTSHQAFLTDEALEEIAKTTLANLKDFFENKPLKNEICYNCETCVHCK